VSGPAEDAVESRELPSTSLRGVSHLWTARENLACWERLRVTPQRASDSSGFAEKRAENTRPCFDPPVPCPDMVFVRFVFTASKLRHVLFHCKPRLQQGEGKMAGRSSCLELRSQFFFADASERA
jgi:hypothetical protein